jgi:uncharacterized protein with GYD domain
MAGYMLQLSYAPQTVAGFIKKPQDRTRVVEELVESIGGKLVGNWFSFGKYDLVVIIEGANPVSAVACAMAVTSSGAFTKFKTTPLLSTEEGMAAMKQAGTLGYKPPKAG